MKSVLSDNRELAGILLFIGAAQFLTVMMIGESVAPGYSMNENAISDMGTIHETRWFFNPSMFLIGLMNAAAGYFFYRMHGDKVLMTVFAIAGIGAMGAALFPLDSSVGIHGLFALLAFLMMNFEAILTARLLKGTMKLTSLVAGTIGLVFLVMMILVDSELVDPDGSIGHGGVERMVAYPVLIWLVLMGGYLLSGPGVYLRTKGSLPAQE